MIGWGNLTNLFVLEALRSKGFGNLLLQLKLSDVVVGQHRRLLEFILVNDRLPIGADMPT